MSTAWDPINPMVAMGGTCIKQAAWDPFTLTLWIEFQQGNGTIYSFKGFPKAKWQAFKAAGSKGTFYHQHIEGRYQDP
jgi:hypothetical protein